MSADLVEKIFSFGVSTYDGCRRQRRWIICVVVGGQNHTGLWCKARWRDAQHRTHPACDRRYRPRRRRHRLRASRDFPCWRVGAKKWSDALSGGRLHPSWQHVDRRLSVHPETPVKQMQRPSSALRTRSARTSPFVALEPSMARGRRPGNRRTSPPPRLGEMYLHRTTNLETTIAARRR